MLCLILLPPGVGWAQTSLQYSAEVPKEFQTYLNESLSELFQLKGSGGSALHQKIFAGPVSGSTYQTWFFKRVKKISMTENCHVTAKIDSEDEPGVIYISKCVDLSQKTEKKFFWLSILFHEARHLEPEHQHWKHQICVDSSGMAHACDASELGPFALEKVLSSNILKHCQNCSAQTLEQAQEVFDDNITWDKLLPTAVNALEKD